MIMANDWRVDIIDDSSVEFFGASRAATVTHSIVRRVGRQQM